MKLYKAEGEKQSGSHKPMVGFGAGAGAAAAAAAAASADGSRDLGDGTSYSGSGSSGGRGWGAKEGSGVGEYGWSISHSFSRGSLTLNTNFPFFFVWCTELAPGIHGHKLWDDDNSGALLFFVGWLSNVNGARTRETSVDLPFADQYKY